MIKKFFIFLTVFATLILAIPTVKVWAQDEAGQHLEHIRDRVKNQALKDEIEERIQNQDQSQEKIQNALTHIEGRPAYLKFLIGPDYKNAGQLRSEIVQLRNEIKQLENLKTRLTGDDADEVQTSIDELQAQSDELESSLKTKLSGFSLFGWLTKYFSGNQE